MYSKWLQEKFKQKIYHANVNINLMVESVIQMKSGIMINVNASAKNIAYVKKFIFGILLHVVAKIVSILQGLLMIQWLRVMKL